MRKLDPSLLILTLLSRRGAQQTAHNRNTYNTVINIQVLDVEAAIQARKSEVEKLIQEMKSANLESLTISPPEESKVFLDGKNS